MKYLKKVLLILFFLFSLFVLYIEFGGRYIISKNDRRVIAWHIKSSQKLPKNFTNFYNTVYLNSLSENSWNWVLNALLNPKTITRKECPCNQATYRILPLLEIKNKSSIDYFLITRYIEQHYNQKECLNFNFSNFDFLESRKGIKQISKSLFNKNIENLHPIEMAEILTLYEQPLGNSRRKNPERAKKRTQYFYNLYSENLKK